MATSTIVWFQKDLRLSDNRAWAEALTHGAPVIPVFIYAPEEEGDWAPGAASRWWMHHALLDLASALEKRSLRLILRKGPTLKSLEDLARENNSNRIYWNRRYEPAVIQRNTAIKERLSQAGITTYSFNSCLLFEPWEIATGAGAPYRVYTPFSRKAMALGYPQPVDAGNTKPAIPASWPESLSLAQLDLLPSIAWDKGIREAWEPRRADGLKRLDEFLTGPVRDYGENRNLPAQDGTSRLSPYLHFGQIGPREVVDWIFRSEPSDGRETFLKEILWREFAHHVLYHFPDTPSHPLQKSFERFPWQSDAEALRAWQRGRTGYPIVDAGMRQLWETGWMHNRVRMIVASLLVKHLLLPWQEGARWFWDTLVDADLANNTLGWQWAGGCGADAAPYFRIFNPITQGEKFDADGAFVRRFVPELTALPNRYIHRPWETPPDVLRQANIKLGVTYPYPIIDHKKGRERALAAFGSLKQKTA